MSCLTLTVPRHLICSGAERVGHFLQTEFVTKANTALGDAEDPFLIWVSLLSCGGGIPVRMDLSRRFGSYRDYYSITQMSSFYRASITKYHNLYTALFWFCQAGMHRLHFPQSYA